MMILTLTSPALILDEHPIIDPAALPDFSRFPTWDEIAAQVAQEEMEATRKEQEASQEASRAEREAALQAVRHQVAAAAEPITGQHPIVQSPFRRDQHLGALEAVLEHVRDICVTVRRTRRVTDLEQALHAIGGVL